jgi:hypothetical protein
MKEAANRAGVAATVLAGVGKSDCVENPVARFGVAEKPDITAAATSAICAIRMSEVLPGRTLATSRAWEGRFNDAAAKLLTRPPLFSN